MWGHGYNMGFMGGWGGSGWTGSFDMFFGLIFLVILVALAVWFFRSGRWPGAAAPLAGPRSSGLAILEERYARGEIDRDEFLKKKQDLGA